MIRLAASVAWAPLGAVAYATDSPWLWLAAIGALVAIAVDAVVRHETRRVKPAPEPAHAPTVYLPPIEEAADA